MVFNGNKFELLRYGHNEELQTISNYLTPDAKDIIDEKDVLRYLGVIIVVLTKVNLFLKEQGENVQYPL